MNRGILRIINARTLDPERIRDLEIRKAILTLQEGSRRAQALEQSALQDIDCVWPNYSPNVSKEVKP